MAALLPLLPHVVRPCSAARCFSHISLRFNLLSSYNSLQVLQSSCPQAVWKMATTSFQSTYAEPEGALKLFGLRPADCPALGISGNLMPSSLGVGCEKPMIWPVSLFSCGHKCWFIIPPATQSMCVGVRSSGSRSGETTSLELLVHGAGGGLFGCFF